MNEYEQKQEARCERYLERAKKAEQEANRAHDSRKQIQDLIPFGQPILVGHHSEKRHRRDIAKVDRLMEKAYNESKKADYYRDKAASVGEGGISSDDPEAVQKLKDKLAKLEKDQETMKAANKIIKLSKLTTEEKIERLQAEINISHVNAVKLMQPDFAGRIGFASYALQNNNANMRRIKQRIQQLESVSKLHTAEIKIGQFRIVQNIEENRIQVFTDSKPAIEIRQALKSHGFRWARVNTCWQRHLSNGALYWAKSIANQFSESEASHE